MTSPVEIYCADCHHLFELDYAGTVRGLCPACRARRRGRCPAHPDLPGDRAYGLCEACADRYHEAADTG